VLARKLLDAAVTSFQRDWAGARRRRVVDRRADRLPGLRMNVFSHFF
jgi:hypothetical protein